LPRTLRARTPRWPGLSKRFEEVGKILNGHAQIDPNDWRTVKENSLGIRYTPLITRNHTRVGSRERE